MNQKQIKVECECCGAKFRLERLLQQGETERHVVCSSCEASLTVDLTRKLPIGTVTTSGAKG